MGIILPLWDPPPTPGLVGLLTPDPPFVNVYALASSIEREDMEVDGARLGVAPGGGGVGAVGGTE